MNPFDLRGPEFLVFYVLLSAAVMGFIVLLRRLSESGKAPRIDLADPYLIAYLRGGENEAMRVALVSLIDRGLIKVKGTQIQRLGNTGLNSVRRPIEKVLMARCAQAVGANEIFGDPDLDSACAEYQETLERTQLLPDDSMARSRLLRFVVAVAILGGVGGWKILIALERGRTNIGFLAALIIIALFLAYKVSFPRLTARGKNMLADVQALYSGLKDRANFIPPGGRTIEPMMLAAAFGVGALAGDGFAYTKTLFPRAQQSGSSSGSTCGSSCGSSCSGGGGGCGGGGGGCGGCGS